MNRRSAPPFLVLSDDVVNFGKWMIGDKGQPLTKAGDFLENWDYERDLEVAANVDLNLEEAASSLNIDPAELSITAVLKAGTGAGSMPRKIEILKVQPVRVNGDFRIIGYPSSSQLSGRLHLELALLLDYVPTRSGPLSPKWRGARLWHNRTDILIEDGGVSRFPIELISFGQTFSGTPQLNAPWYLDWKVGDIHSDFGAAVRVYVNSDFPELAERFTAGDPLTLQAILGDVMSQMTESLLEIADCEQILDECEASSVGYQIRNWMDIALPGQSISSMKSMKEHTPGRFRSAMLAAADVGGIE